MKTEKLLKCRYCGRKPKRSWSVSPPPYHYDVCSYACKCGATTDETDGLPAEAINRWNEQCGERRAKRAEAE